MKFCRRGEVGYDVIKGEFLVVEEGHKFKSFSRAFLHVTGTHGNGWDYWEVKLPWSNEWVVVADLRSKDSEDDADD